MEDRFVGQIIDHYKILDRRGEGDIGKVYRAWREDMDIIRAIKFIPEGNIRPEWDNEIKKVVKLTNISGVVPYHAHGSISIGEDKYIWIMWDFIPGDSLRELISRNGVTISIIRDVLNKVLTVLHACKSVGIQHADLHTGNILIQEPDFRSIVPSARNVWITDFGYGHASLGSDILDDYKGLNRIIQDCLQVINFHPLEGEEKAIYSVLKHEFGRYLLETNQTEGTYVRNPAGLINQFEKLRQARSNSIISNKTNIEDYLAAELIGDRYNEWKHLFVAQFLGAEELMGKNICVLTGLRGCGKTMIFRRATALFDLELGPSGVANGDSFLGFYLNARNVAEAFPWLPSKHKEIAREQVINFFHISWLLEVVEWLRAYSRKYKDVDFGWLLHFLSKYFPEIFATVNNNLTMLDHIYFFLMVKLDASRLKSGYTKKSWELTDYQFLDKLFDEISINCTWIGHRTFYLFLDDYSMPMVNSTTQEILNPIILRRSSKIIFKVATESVESFYNIGLNGKMLEEKDDYLLIDFGTQSILRNEEEMKVILSAIMKPRIERNEAFTGKGLNIQDLLGQTDYDNTTLALMIKGEKPKQNTNPKYYGFQSFCSVWSSNVREMISIFAEMISLVKISDDFDKVNGRIVSIDVQDKVLRNSGGVFLNLLSSATPPTEDCYDDIEYHGSYGEHLVKIAKAFQEMSSYVLRNKTSKNMENNPPKQARRIEIKDIESFRDKEIQDYYKGIVRYGLFIRDNRGKSVRGKAVPRLYLRGLLIPYFTLTFSKRDHITFSWKDFCAFLKEPDKFAEEYIKVQKNKASEEENNGNIEQTSLEL